MSTDLLITLIFAAIAAFVIFKLRSVLGRRTGHEGSHDMLRRGGDAPAGGNDNVVPLPERRDSAADGYTGTATEAEDGIRAIQRADPGFDPDGFLGGAKQAFRMIVDAYAAGDRDTLENLLASDVYRDFAAAIDERQRDGHTFEARVEGMRNAEIADAELVGHEARVTVLFVTEQSNATRDRNGNVIDGDPDVTETVSDLWTFARDTSTDDPNWKLIETATPE